MKYLPFIVGFVISFTIVYLITPGRAHGASDKIPKGQSKIHAHGPHENPQGNLVGNGDPSFSTSWWWNWTPNGVVQVEGYTTVDGIPNLLEQGHTTLHDVTVGNVGYDQYGTCYSCNFDIDSIPAPVIPGHAYQVGWTVTATLPAGWTWGSFTDPACVVQVGATVVICTYLNPPTILQPLSQATPTPVPPTPTPVVPTPTPVQTFPPKCTIRPTVNHDLTYNELSISASSENAQPVRIAQIVLVGDAKPVDIGFVHPIGIAIATGNDTNLQVIRLPWIPALVRGEAYIAKYSAQVSTNQGVATCTGGSAIVN